MKLVLGAWQSPLPRLLIFDNCEDEALLAQWRPPTGGAHVRWTPQIACRGVVPAYADFARFL